MTQTKARVLMVTGSHSTIRQEVALEIERANLWGEVDLVAFEGATHALCDPKHPYHKGAMEQVKISLTLHEPDEVWFLGPTNWAEILKSGSRPSEECMRSVLKGAAFRVMNEFQLKESQVNPVLLDIEALFDSEAKRLSQLPLPKDDVLVLSCIDLRFVRQVMDWIAQMGNGCVHLTSLAGATGAINNALTRPIVEGQLNTFSLSSVEFGPHWDCGYFGGAGQCNKDRKRHARRHFKEAKAAGGFIRKIAPNLGIKGRLLEPNRMVPLPV